MTRDEIIEGIIEVMEHCYAECDCHDCPIQKYCDEWEKVVDKVK